MDPEKQRKSVLLIKAMGWKWKKEPWEYDPEVDDYVNSLRYFTLEDESGNKIKTIVREEGAEWALWGPPEPNLYKPANMVWMWRVLNWAIKDVYLFTDWLCENVARQTGYHNFDRVTHATRWWFLLLDQDGDSQVVLLDKIFELAIEGDG